MAGMQFVWAGTESGDWHLHMAWAGSGHKHVSAMASRGWTACCMFDPGREEQPAPCVHPQLRCRGEGWMGRSYSGSLSALSTRLIFPQGWLRQAIAWYPNIAPRSGGTASALLRCEQIILYLWLRSISEWQWPLLPPPVSPQELFGNLRTPLIKAGGWQRAWGCHCPCCHVLRQWAAAIWGDGTPCPV